MRFNAVVAIYAAGVSAALAPAPAPVADADSDVSPAAPSMGPAIVGPADSSLTGESAAAAAASGWVTSTVYETKTYTVTDCPDTETKCPESQTRIVTATVAVSTTVCPAEETESPSKPSSPAGGGGSKPTAPAPGGEDSGNKPTKPSAGGSGSAPKPACPSTTVKTITSSYTTVLPTVIHVTETVDCPAEPTYPAKPTGASPSKPGNGTSPAKPKPVTAGAGSVAGSVIFAAVAGLAAFAFA